MGFKNQIKKCESLMNIYHKVCKAYFAFICETNIKRAVEIRYKQNLGTKPNLKDPKTINEKLQVLKLGRYYNNPIITTCVDKFLVKEYVKKLFPNGELKVAKLYAAFDTVEEFVKYGVDRYPSCFVVKCNHGCGYNMLIKDKKDFDMDEARRTLDAWMNEDFWTIAAEPQYKFVERKILVEEYLGDNLEAYKLYCFNGTPMYVYVSSADDTGVKDKYLDYFDMSWNHLDIQLGDHIHYPGKIPMPENWGGAIEIAKLLASDFPFVRVDLYITNGDIYLSELTFLPTGGYMRMHPQRVEREWGDLLKIETERKGQ